MGKGLTLFWAGIGAYLTGAVLSIASFHFPVSEEWRRAEDLHHRIYRIEMKQLDRNYREPQREADNLQLKIVKGEYDSVCLNSEMERIMQTRKYERNSGAGLMLLSTIPVGIGIISHANDVHKKSRK